MLSKLFLGTLVLHTLHVPDQIHEVVIAPSVVAKIDRYNILVGTNSIQEPIVGAAYDFKVNRYTNFKLGGYLQDNHKFNERGVRMYFGDLVPIVGMELNIPLRNNIDFTTIVTPNLIVYGITFDIGVEDEK